MRLPIWFRLLVNFLYLREDYRDPANCAYSPRAYRRTLEAWDESLPRPEGLVEKIALTIARRRIGKEIAACKQLEAWNVVQVGITRRE